MYLTQNIPLNQWFSTRSPKPTNVQVKMLKEEEAIIKKSLRNSTIIILINPLNNFYFFIRFEMIF